MPEQRENLRIDGPRLWDSLMRMAQVGPGVAGGNNRQTLTDADAEGRALFRRWAEDAGCEVSVDEIGTIFAGRRGEDTDALPVYVGSHLDTQPTGGKYDGVLGVLAGLELVRSLNDLGIRTRRGIVITNWTNEEGTRFAPSLLGSGAFTGLYGLDWAYGRLDAEGVRFGDELARIGWRGAEPVGRRRMHACFEYHIEQGPILEAEGADIGVVTHGQGFWWLEVRLTGEAAHTGATPMRMRHDAGLGIARVVEAAHRIAMDHQPDAVGAAGQINVYPNSRNVVPGRAVCTVDFRSPDLTKLTAMRRQLEAEAAAIADALGLGMEIEPTGHFDPVAFDPHCVALVRDAAERLGYRHMDIVSGAGHDACIVSSVAPTAMVFCPCKGGISHNEAEEITPEWAEKGANVLLQAVIEAAEVVD